MLALSVDNSDPYLSAWQQQLAGQRKWKLADENAQSCWFSVGSTDTRADQQEADGVS